MQKYTVKEFSQGHFTELRLQGIIILSDPLLPIMDFSSKNWKIVNFYQDVSLQS